MNILKNLKKISNFMFLLILILSFHSIISARTIIVDQNGEGDYLTIQEGIDASHDGDVVIVYPGVYLESIVISDKEIKVIGSGPDATGISASTDYAVKFDRHSDASKIIGFSITSAGGTGIYTGGNSWPGISNCIISSGGMGLQVYQGASINNCIIFGCGGNAIDFKGTSKGLAITNCILYNNGGYAVYNDSYSYYVTISYSDLWNNYMGNYGGKIDYIVIGSGIIEEDPQFINPGMDFHLKQSSPCIDAGKPGFASLDPDGTRNDIGAYGGPYARMTGFIGPVVTNLEIIPSIVKQGETITIKATGIVR